MMDENQKIKVKDARDALSLLYQKMYEKYGEEALPEIEDVWYQFGCSIGEKIKKSCVPSV